MLRHVKAMHKKQLKGHKGNTVVGPMERFLGSSSGIEKKLAEDSVVSDALVREAIKNFILSETEPFSVFDSEAFMTLLKLCLKCKRDNVFIPKEDALRNEIIKRVEKMKVDLKDLIASSGSFVHLCLDMWTSNMFSFLAITTHYISSDWTFVEKS